MRDEREETLEVPFFYGDHLQCQQNKRIRTNQTPTKDKSVETVPFDRSKIKKLRAVTVPLLKQKDEKEIFVKITGPMFEAQPIKKSSQGDGDTKEEKRKPPTLVRVINLETDEEMELIVNAVLKSTLEDEYPNDGYVGKTFEIVSHSIEGRDYKTYDVTEIDWD